MAEVTSRCSRWHGAIGLLALTVLLTGCFRYDHRIKVDDDGGGSVQITALFDPEIAFEELTGQRVIFNRSAGYDRDAVCDALKPPDDLDLGVEDETIIPYEKDDFCGFRAETVLEPSVDHSETMESIFEPGSILIKTGDGWEFKAVLDQTLFIDTVESLELTDFEFDKYADLAEYRIDIDLPGAAVDGMNNADDVAGGRFIWNIDVLNVPEEIYAATTPAPPFWENTTTLAVLGVLGAGLLAILGFFVFGGRERAPAEAPPMEQKLVDQKPVKQKKLRRQREPEVVAAVNTEPHFDETFGVWVRDDPVHGRLWHDTKRNVWVPF